jgi:hypothetical protein
VEGWEVFFCGPGVGVECELLVGKADEPGFAADVQDGGDRKAFGLGVVKGDGCVGGGVDDSSFGLQVDEAGCRDGVCPD